MPDSRATGPTLNMFTAAMKILIYSPSFYPKIGGLENIVSSLAEEFTSLGYIVKLVSLTPATDDKEFAFEVIRNPSPQKLLRLTKWCDVFFQGCISIKGLWPQLLIRRPLVITHQTWYCRANGRQSFRDRLKQFITKFATNISVSQDIAKALPAASTIVPNSYRDDLFYELPDSSRDIELVFLGRLVSDKGVSLLLEAIARLRGIGLTPRLSVIGQGPEETALRQQAKTLGIAEQVKFVGLKTGLALTQLLNQHQIMVVPSLWKEPFGIVALEGIACGCVVVGSQGGGLKDAIGPCGITVPNGDVDALFTVLSELLSSRELLATYRAKAEVHLAHHHASTIAQRYSEAIEAAVK